MNKFRQIDKIFEKEYSIEPTRHFMSYGRLEIIGNHTDHQRGHCIVATCSQGIKGAVKERDDGIIHFYSEGYGSFEVDVHHLEMKKEETGRPISLVKGVLKGLQNFGSDKWGEDISAAWNNAFVKQ